MALASTPTPRSANSGRPTQLRLFSLVDPLTERFGSLWFRALPQEPGVYFFRGAQDELLYIGQSLNLRARIGSYRHVTPEKNARRTLRLVSKTMKIEWQVCATARDAIELERTLLLEHRPPFNRAGVWPGSPWWLKVGIEGERVRLCLTATADAEGIGPLPSSFRYVFGSLARCIYRLAYPLVPMAHYPHGLFAPRVPLNLVLSLPSGGEAAQIITAFASGQAEQLLAQLAGMEEIACAIQREYWQKEVEGLQKYAAKPKKVWLPPKQEHLRVLDDYGFFSAWNI